MNAALRKFAGFGAAVVVAASLTTGAVAGPPRAVADPDEGDSPSAQTLAPPPPRAAPPPAPRAAPPPGSSDSSASDEPAIRQTVQASTNAYNAQDWGAFMGFICAGRQPSFPLSMIKNQRAERGPMQSAVTAVTVTGNTATAMTVMTDRITVTVPYHMVREGAWKIC